MFKMKLVWSTIVFPILRGKIQCRNDIKDYPVARIDKAISGPV